MSMGRNALFGVAGGVAGLVAMRYAMQATRRLMPKGGDEEYAGNGEGSSEDDSWALFGMQRREGESATGAVGRIAYEKLLRREPSEELVQKMSNWVHWGHGETMAVLYGLMAARRGGPLKGTAFGLLLWLFGDELIVPLLGLSRKPTSTPLSQHLPPLVAHLAYGGAVGATVRAVARAVGEDKSA
jgi:hypothetical protein